MRFILKVDTGQGEGVRFNRLRLMSSRKCLCKYLYGTFALKAKRRLGDSPQK